MTSMDLLWQVVLLGGIVLVVGYTYFRFHNECVCGHEEHQHIPNVQIDGVHLDVCTGEGFRCACGRYRRL
jgi:hypothetical protein